VLPLTEALTKAAVEADAQSKRTRDRMESVRLATLADVLRAEARIAQQKHQPRTWMVAV
jgi:hypothetical protein